MNFSIDELRQMTTAECGRLLELGRNGFGSVTLEIGITAYLSKHGEGDGVAGYIVEFVPDDENPESYLDEVSLDGFDTDSNFHLAAHAAVNDVIIPAIEKFGA